MKNKHTQNFKRQLNPALPAVFFNWVWFLVVVVLVAFSPKKNDEDHDRRVAR